MSRRNGFTLIELVIVVAIVGILASATVPLARWGVKRSKEHELQESLRILRNAIDRYHDAAQAGLIEVPEDNPGYPPDLEVLVEGVPLTGPMPPVVPGASDEYDATGPGLSGGLQEQVEEGQGAGAGGSGGTGGAGGTTSRGPGQGVRFGGFGDAGGSGGAEQRRGAGLAGRIASELGTGRQDRQGGGGTRQSQGQGGQGLGGGVAFGQFGGGGDGDGQPPLGPDGEPLKLVFLRRIPVDPMTGEREWGKRCYGEPPDDRLWCGRNVFDVYSRSLDRSIDGNAYRDW